MSYLLQRLSLRERLRQSEVSKPHIPHIRREYKTVVRLKKKYIRDERTKIPFCEKMSNSDSSSAFRAGWVEHDVIDTKHHTKDEIAIQQDKMSSETT